MPPPDATPDIDRDAPARAERVAARVAACEADVWAALLPILAHYRCRLVTVQTLVDGQPGPVQIRVAANE